MSIPRRQSRILSLHGQSYRWRVRHHPTYARALNESSIVLVVQSADAARGTVLVATLPFAHPSNWFDSQGGSVTPALATEVIERALSAGWEPHEPGKQFRLSVTDAKLNANAEPGHWSEQAPASHILLIAGCAPPPPVAQFVLVRR